MASSPPVPVIPVSFPDQSAPEKKYLRQQIMNLRVVELKELLLFGEKNHSYGTRDILMERCLSMVEDKTTPELAAKINDLYFKRNGTATSKQPVTPLADANPPDSKVETSDSETETEVSIPSCMPAPPSIKDTSGNGPRLLQLESSPFSGQLRLHRALDSKTQVIKMCKLPFYEVKSSLLEPYVLANQKENVSAAELAYCQKSFLIPLSDYKNVLHSCYIQQNSRPIPQTQPILQFQLRFCATDPAAEEQADMLPQGLQVKVNGENVVLPNFAPKTNGPEEPRRHPYPIDITYVSLLTCDEARPEISITVEWNEDETDESGRDYAMAVSIVRKLTAYDLFKKLRFQSPDATIEQVKKITSATEDGVSAPTFVSVSFICPLVKTRMKFPCRAITCSHLQCFDAENFLRMNEVKTKFKCPVCNLNLKFEDMRIDTYTVAALSRCPEAEHIQLYPDGGLKTVKKSEKIEIAVIPQRKRIREDTSGTSLTPSSAPIRKILCIDLEEENNASSFNSDRSGIPVKPPVPVIDITDLDEDDAYTTTDPMHVAAYRRCLPPVLECVDLTDTE